MARKTKVGLPHQPFVAAILTAFLIILRVGEVDGQVKCPTGNYYELVAADGISYTDAETAAAARSFNGLPGYLATITRRKENNCLNQIAKAAGYRVQSEMYSFWIGGRKNLTARNWYWATGPETGQVFYDFSSGSGNCIRFCRWGAGNPVHTNQNTNYLQWRRAVDAGFLKDWVDVRVDPPGRQHAWGYFVEYGGEIPPLGGELSGDGDSLEVPVDTVDHQLVPVDEPLYYVQFNFEPLVEIENGSVIVRSFNLSRNYSVSEDDFSANFTAPLGFGGRYGPSEITFTFVLQNDSSFVSSFPEEVGQVVNQANQAIDSSPFRSNLTSTHVASFEWQMTIKNWDLRRTSNFLRLEINLQTAVDKPIIAREQPFLEDGVVKLRLFTNGTTVFMELPSRVTVDGVERNLTMPEFIDLTTVRLRLPWFNRTLVYDPTLALLLGGQSSYGDGDGDGDGVFDTDSDSDGDGDGDGDSDGDSDGSGDGDGAVAGGGGGSSNGLLIGLTAGLLGGAALIVGGVLFGAAIAFVIFKVHSAQLHKTIATAEMVNL